MLFLTFFTKLFFTRLAHKIGWLLTLDTLETAHVFTGCHYILSNVKKEERRFIFLKFSVTIVYNETSQNWPRRKPALPEYQPNF
jgi:hypothetical protein